MSAFSEKAIKCKHGNVYPDYEAHLPCATPECSRIEYHCKDCGAYFSKCGCGCWNDTVSGWPAARWRNYMKGKIW